MRRLAALVAVALIGAGCGYRFAVGEGGLPADVPAAFVPVFANRSSEAEAGALFAEALSTRLAERGRLAGPGAPARIEGEILSVISSTLATGPQGRGVGLYRVEASVRLALVEEGRTICRRELRGSEEFLPARELLGLEAARRQAVRRLAEKMMAGAENELCPASGRS